MTLIATQVLRRGFGSCCRRGASSCGTNLALQPQGRDTSRCTSPSPSHITLNILSPPNQCNHDHPLGHGNQRLFSSSNQTPSSSAAASSQDNNITNNMSLQEMASLQTKLHDEASYLTRTLYRKCLQSINVIAGGNDRDEDDFAEREAKELDQLDSFSGSVGVDLERISMAPPVNRQNELSSRANYYMAFTREHFEGHWNLLGAHGFHIGDEGNMSHGLGGNVFSQQVNQYQGGHHHLGVQMSAQYSSTQGGGGVGSTDTSKNDDEGGRHYMWREEQVEQFVYLIRSGEEKRQWILSDYEFEDPCDKGWPTELQERLNVFEEKSNELVKEMYRRDGWRHSSDLQDPNSNNADDGFFSDSDSDDE